jgi:hypothetical protein
MKEKHVKLKLAWDGDEEEKDDEERKEELAAVAVGVMPRCHPDSAAIRRSDREASGLRAGRKSVAYTALGWHMAERVQQAQFLPGDALDIAFSVGHNDHPDFGGLELSLRDFRKA